MDTKSTSYKGSNGIPRLPSDRSVAAKPTKSIFDPFNSSATGHQRAENRLSGSTAWRASRSEKLREQFGAGLDGGRRVADTVGSGSPDFGVDGRTANGSFLKGSPGLRRSDQPSLLQCGITYQKPLRGCREQKSRGPCSPTTIVNPFTPFVREDCSIRESSWPNFTHHERSLDEGVDISARTGQLSGSVTKDGSDMKRTTKEKQLFENLTFYVNGSTAPVISDHALKRLLSQHGASLSVALCRRAVTHVIVGRSTSYGGTGGGLSSSKIQKEIGRKNGGNMRYIRVEWVLESIKAGKRQPEMNYQALPFRPQSVKSVSSIFRDRPDP